MPCKVCSTSTDATTSARKLGRPIELGNRSANDSDGNTSLPMISQEREHTADWNEMPDQRTRIHQIKIRTTSTMHLPIVPTEPPDRSDDSQVIQHAPSWTGSPVGAQPLDVAVALDGWVSVCGVYNHSGR
jgi:hypothetical protein